MGVAVDVDRVVALVHRIGAGADVLARADLAARAQKGLIDVPLLLTVDPRAFLALAEPLKEEEDVAPVPARLDLEHHAIVPEKDGGALDLDGAVAALERVARAPVDAAGDEVATVFVPVLPYKSRMTREALAEIDIGNVLASYETSFSRAGDQASRARNVEVAASRIDGAVLLPGQTLSFNQIVGARSEANGFKKAHEIFKGEMVEGVGGGTCQVASTLHAASFFGGLDILERFPHSRPSAYIPIGLDSTVVYPIVDLKLRNPFPFAVVIHSSIVGSRLRVELLGHDKPVAVTYAKSVLATHPFARKVVEEAGVTVPKVKQKGIRGIELRRWRVLRYATGEKRIETSTDTYPPTQEIYRVPPGFDANELPALEEDPEKAKAMSGGVEPRQG
jgi:vancomycin resistance protein YoaR